MRSRRLAWALFVGAAAIGPAVLPTMLAAPWIIRVHGDGLSKPVFITDWHENHRFMLAVNHGASPAAGDLADRPSFEVALFWYAPRWESFLREGRLEQLDPETAEQRGRFYPARGPLPAVFTLYGDAARLRRTHRRVSPDGLEVLARAGVPIG
jgi:hypothetical protein